jgi:dihydrofolate synthase/folylpolyglutamate synthase
MAALHAEAARIGARLLEVPPTELWDGVFPLAGAHQRANVAIAVAAGLSLAPLDDATIARGLSRTRWPGRLQRLSRPGRREVILDGAHNPDGALAVAAWLDEAGLAGRVDLLFGAMGDKDLAGVFTPLASRARRVVFAAAPSPRSAAPHALKVRLGPDDAQTAPSVERALACLDAEGPIASPVLVAGSLYLVGEVLRLLERESG